MRARALSRLRPRRRREAGSAYLIVLLALVVLTILGLSLATITGLEMEVGANERGVTRVFYSADSGVNVSLAHALASGEYRSRQIRMYEGSQTTPNGTQLGRGSEIEISHFVPILWEPCNWCPVNENEQNFFKVNHASTATARELSWTGTAAVPPADANIQSQKTIAVMIEVQPWFEPPPESLPTDPAELAKVKF